MDANLRKDEVIQFCPMGQSSHFLVLFVGYGNGNVVNQDLHFGVAVSSAHADRVLFFMIPLPGSTAFWCFATRQVFDGSKSTEDVYNTVGKPLVDSVIQGIHGTLFAYGQTGSGKTFSMTGQRAEAKRGRSQKEVPGIVQLAANDLFTHIRNTASSGEAGKESKEEVEEDLEKGVEDAEEEKEAAVKARGGSATDGDKVSFKVVASFVEIYNENIRVRVVLPLPRPHHTGARTPYSLGSCSLVPPGSPPVLGPWDRRLHTCLLGLVYPFVRA